MYPWFVCVVGLCAASSAVAADCVEPATLARSTVSITREFREADATTKPDLIGIRGTGWFLSSRLIVTAAHVADAMQLTPGDWTDLQIRERDTLRSSPARVVKILGFQAEKLAVLELKTSFPGATALPVRAAPLIPEERVTSLGYPGGRLRTAEGRFVQFGSDNQTAGAALIEMSDGEDRLVLDHGSSGAPVVDCAGQVVGVVAKTFSQTIRFQSQVIRISTPWQSPNVVAIPITEVRDFSWPE